MSTCLGCPKETHNPKFCSRSCSTRYFNSITPKRKTDRTRVCSCGTKKDPRSSMCTTCYKAKTVTNLETATIETYLYSKKNSPQSLYGRIRLNARRVAEPYKSLGCSVCGYQAHVEVAHIKSISSFPKNTLISIVNSLENLSLLCPNHHWEFDNGLLHKPTSLSESSLY